MREPDLRRPSDLAREMGPGGHRRDGVGREGPAAAWPAGFASTLEDRRALVVLLHLASVVAGRLLDLAQGCRTATGCLAAIQAGSMGSAKDQVRARELDPDDAMGRVYAAGARFVPVGSPEYPPELLDLADPPAALFVRGAATPETSVASTGRGRVAIVGARSCSAMGAEVASWLARRLADCGVCVVSGGARGVDAAAHRAALDAGGQTIAVLGSGIDVLYPRTNRSLLEQVAERGTVISEYPPGTPAEPFRFPARNRIVAALARGVVVVEGGEGSGALITAEQAADLGREVFGVPGPVVSPLSQAPLTLIRDGAALIRGPEDLLHDLGIPVVPDPTLNGAPGWLRGAEASVFASLGAASTPDALAAATGLSVGAVMSALTTLEVRGAVLQAGGRYQRKPGV